MELLSIKLLFILLYSELFVVMIKNCVLNIIENRHQKRLEKVKKNT